MPVSAAFSKYSRRASPQRPYGSGSCGGSAANIGTWRETGGMGGGGASARALRAGLAEPPRRVLGGQHVQMHAGADLEAGQLCEARHDLDSPAEVLGVAWRGAHPHVERRQVAKRAAEPVEHVVEQPAAERAVVGEASSRAARRDHEVER